MSARRLVNVLIDTDIGDDVDDAFALALAARLPDLRLCGVTTVVGPVERRAALAAALLAAAGRPDVPVVAGARAMSDGRPGPARFSHEIGEWGETIGGFSKVQVTDFVLALSRDHAPLTIIGLGPLTNIAAALGRDPALAGRARLVAMGGALCPPYPDWNLRCDPAAARAVLRSGLPVTLVGMHVTRRARFGPARLRRLLATDDPLARVLGRCVLAWRTWQRRTPILHDALTVAIAWDPALARLEARRVLVGWRGFSAALRRGPPNALVCLDAAIARFDRLLAAALLSRADA